MKRSIPVGESPYANGLTLYSAILESEDGYTETQGYACLPEERDAVIAQALDEFCAARGARVSFVEDMYA
jgi:hypothetical protein